MTEETFKPVVVTDSSLIAGIQGIPLGASRVAVIVTLRGGKSYMYLITRSTYVEFLAASSKGQYYNRTIKGAGKSTFISDLNAEVIEAGLIQLGVADLAKRKPDGKLEYVGLVAFNATASAMFPTVVPDAPFAFD